MTPEQRFIRKVAKMDGCWIWQGSIDRGGYGWFKVNGKFTLVHRFAYERYKGPIPEGLTIDHLCRNRACVSPEHLEAVTLRENILRGDNMAARNARKTHCPQGHEYTEENTQWWGRNRYCRTCHRIHSKNSRKV